MSFRLLEDGTSFRLLEDGTSKRLLEDGSGASSDVLFENLNHAIHLGLKAQTAAGMGGVLVE